MKEMDSDKIRHMVRDRYARAAAGGPCGCPASAAKSCCDSSKSIADSTNDIMGYSSEDLGSVVEGANLGLGCGNPTAIGNLKQGETVLDLGSGGGFDCFLAAKKVGDKGRVIGVDMTPEMIAKSRGNAEKAGFKNLDFRLGELENLPVADGIVDVIISNCVINLSPEKESVFSEAFRVLKPGGRLAISDIVATAELPDEIRKDLACHTACIAGASLIQELESILQKNGFENIHIKPKPESKEFIRNWMPGRKIEQDEVSATIEAIKPLA